MKVSIKVTVDVDPEMYYLVYGVEGAKSIREDVQSHGHNIIVESMRDCGVLKEN